MRPFRHFAALALLLVAASPALADIALPRREKAHRDDEIRTDLPDVKMTIQRVEGLREARLQIPRSQLGRMNELAGVTQGGADSARAGTFRGAGTVVAGLFLSLSVVLTGLLLVRSRRGAAVGRAAAVLLVCACAAAGLAAVAAYANAGLPGWQPQNPGTLTKAAPARPLAGWVRVEVVEEGYEIKLLVPAKSQGGGEEE
ncbi:MAG TPA: hypothetical protein VF659_14030 [Pyrinomonadaceae bacterium]|jgi:hypothetical protein